MISKCLISSVIVVLSVMSAAGFLYADKPCGYSIHPNIKTPPLNLLEAESQGKDGWSNTISQPGATWIKLHFSKFHLNDDDYVDLIDKNGIVIERIKGIDVSDDQSSKFSVKKNGPQKVSFWGPAINGDTVKINVHQEKGKNKPDGWGFCIDEVGVGTAPIGNDAELLWDYNVFTRIACYINYSFYIRARAVGWMLYRKVNTWYYGNGFLMSHCGSSHFLTTYGNMHIPYGYYNPQFIIDTLEVRFGYFYMYCDITIYTMCSWSSYYGGTHIQSDINKNFTLLTLNGSPQTVYTPLRSIKRNPVTTEDLYTIEYANGNPANIGFHKVVSTGTNAFNYDINTTTSGTPIFVTDSNDGVDDVLGIGSAGSGERSTVNMPVIVDVIKNYIGTN